MMCDCDSLGNDRRPYFHSQTACFQISFPGLPVASRIEKLYNTGHPFRATEAAEPGNRSSQQELLPLPSLTIENYV